LKVKVIIPASGSGERFGGNTPKQFIRLKGKEILVSCLEKFNSIKVIDEIIIATKLEYFLRITELIQKHKLKKVKKITEGGNRRQDSVYNALVSLDCSKDDIILIHDAVRPFISEKKIIEIINAAKEYKCIVPGLPVAETVKRTLKNNIVKETIDRNNLWTIQTPQAFRFDILKKSFDKAYKENFTGTDESAIVENAGYKVKVIEGEMTNVKITFRKDIYDF
jgi:2-C-methyl-D-erythritol 4-phosphate cytidylyltransferase